MSEEVNQIILKILNERSLNRMISHGEQHDLGCISAFRSEYADKVTDVYGNVRIKNISPVNRKRNSELRKKLREMGYSITKQMGKWFENDYPAFEESILVVDINDSGNLENDLIKLGAFYEQDSILFKPKGEDPYLVKTKGNRHGLKSRKSDRTLYKRQGEYGYSTIGHSDYTYDIDDEQFFNSELD